MNNRSRVLDAKRRICEHFPAGIDPVQSASSISDNDLISLLDAVRETIPWKKPVQCSSLSMFLYAGVRRFDRWFPPSPFVASVDQSLNFSKFVMAFEKAEGADPTNSPVFALHKIKDDIYKKFDAKPIDRINLADIEVFREKIKLLSKPANFEKKEEFDKELTDLKLLLDGLEDASLQTNLQFRIPYVIHKNPLRLKFMWEGVSISAEINPVFGEPAETFFHIEAHNAALPSGASRWQAGTSNVSLKLSTLLDGSSYTDRLQAISGVELPEKGWPKSFTWAFSIFHDLAWKLRMEHAGRQDWIPAPRDISALEQHIATKHSARLNWIMKGSPAAHYQIFVPPVEPLEIEMGVLGRPSWASECRIRSGMYLELGDTSEALFWLNVGIESLIAHRFNEIEIATGIKELAATLGSPKEFWAEAEIILTKQYPELSGKTKWPTSPVHVSVFGKIKSLYRKVPMKTNIDLMLAKYKEISRLRNELFHGNLSLRVSVADVINANEAFSWIDANMWNLEQMAVNKE